MPGGGMSVQAGHHQLVLVLLLWFCFLKVEKAIGGEVNSCKTNANDRAVTNYIFFVSDPIFCSKILIPDPRNVAKISLKLADSDPIGLVIPDPGTMIPDLGAVILYSIHLDTTLKRELLSTYSSECRKPL